MNAGQKFTLSVDEEMERMYGKESLTAWKSISAPTRSVEAIARDLLAMHDGDVFVREPWDATFEELRAALGESANPVAERDLVPGADDLDETVEAGRAWPVNQEEGS
jgi:hypothetical protein